MSQTAAHRHFQEAAKGGDRSESNSRCMVLNLGTKLKLHVSKAEKQSTGFTYCHTPFTVMRDLPKTLTTILFHHSI